MAESNSAATPGHLDTNIESGKFDEKEAAAAPIPSTLKPKPEAEEEEDEDMDALIEDLESHDGHAEDDDEEETSPGGKLPPPCSEQFFHRGRAMSPAVQTLRLVSWAPR